MSQEKQPLRIRYDYVHAPEARLQYAHGVIGGINSQGEVEMNFYTESDKLPAYSESIIAPDGSLGHEIAPADEEVKQVARFIHSKVILNYYAARDLVEWLEEQIAALEAEGRNQTFFDDEDGGFPH
ncbi:MAG: hypothetical protein LBP61_02280 [Desulfovibrio sp.]|jgi:hypothetical protein|nr:hypothetical protein [Desulfovibrio sp.]